MNSKTLRILEYDKIKHILSNYCATSLGKHLCEDLKPSTDINEVQTMQNETEEAINMIYRKSSPPFGGVHDISLSLKRVESEAVLSIKELLEIGDTLRGCRNLKKYCEDDSEKLGQNLFPILFELFNNLYSNKGFEDTIENSIANEESLTDWASPTLNSIRKQIKEAEGRIKDKLNQITHSATYSKYLQDSIVTIRENRYVIPVKQEYKNVIQGLVHDSSATGATLFIEPIAVVEANNTIRELKVKEQKEIERILTDLTSKVYGMLDNLVQNLEILTKLDFYFAKAKFGIDYRCVKPILNDYGYINLIKARHPLIDKNRVVPIDIYLGKEFNTLVVTGPNTGGKTVTLKTTGLLTLMTQSGLHIPCNDRSEVCVFNKVFADIGDEQSIEQSLSTFSSHMKNITSILAQVDDNTLVLLDELGAGTDPIEGSALAISILESIYNKGGKVVATTHYSELKTYAISTSGVENASCEFNVETLAPTYKLLIGIPGKSNAFAISKKLGLTEDIINRAKDFITSENIKFEDVIEKIEKDKKLLELERYKSTALLEEAKELQLKLEIKNEEMQKQTQKILENARLEARNILLEAKEEADSTISKIKKASENMNLNTSKVVDEHRDNLNKRLKDVQSKLSKSAKTGSKPKFEINIGDTVLVTTISQNGTVLTPPDKDGNVLLQVGIMKVNMPIANLAPAKQERTTVGNVSVSNSAKLRSKDVSPEIHLRGMKYEDALEELDKYIDNAVMASLSIVTIVHGKGTGVLRAAVHDYLKGHPRVKSYRLGKFGEGENGVTIVELK